MSMPYGRRRGRSYTRKIKGRPPKPKALAVKPAPTLWGRIKAAFSLFGRAFK